MHRISMVEKRQHMLPLIHYSCKRRRCNFKLIRSTSIIAVVFPHSFIIHEKIPPKQNIWRCQMDHQAKAAAIVSRLATCCLYIDLKMEYLASWYFLTSGSCDGSTTCKIQCKRVHKPCRKWEPISSAAKFYLSSTRGVIDPCALLRIRGIYLMGLLQKSP